MYAQIPIWLLPPLVLYFARDHLKIGFGLLLGFFVIVQIWFGFILQEADSIAGDAFLILGIVPFAMFILMGVAVMAAICGCADLDPWDCASLPMGKIEECHGLFWGGYTVTLGCVIFVIWLVAQFESHLNFAVVTSVLVVIWSIPLIVKVVEFVVESCSQTNVTLKRRLLVARLFGMALFFVLQQMNVPLAQFFLEAVFRMDMSGYLRLMLTLVMIGIQVFAVLAFNYVMIAGFSGDEESYMALLDGVQTAATSNYEIHRYEYRFWIVFEIFYDLVNSLWTNVGSRGYPDVYWLNVACHLFYIYIHGTLRPCIYDLHNWVDVSTGVAQFLEDIAVLQSIYGNGSLVASGTWTYVCALIPLAAGIVDWIYVKIKEKLEEDQKKEASLDARCEVENRMLRGIFLFVFLGTFGGVIFMNLVSVVGIEGPPGYWWGLYVLAPLFTILLYVPSIFVFKYGDWTAESCMRTVRNLCNRVFCWCRRVRISPDSGSEDPDIGNPSRGQGDNPATGQWSNPPTGQWNDPPD
jgi:hypothetical protein